VGYDFERIQFDLTRYVGAKSKCLVVDKQRRLVPGHQPTPLIEGLGQTVDWFWEHRDLLLPAVQRLSA
jgi:GDP-L-fucose synthase